MNKFTAAIFLALISFLFINTADAANLINGDFETGTLSGWSTAGTVAISTSNVINGTYSAHATGTGSIIQQTAATTPGTAYTAGLLVNTVGGSAVVDIKDAGGTIYKNTSCTGSCNLSHTFAAVGESVLIRVYVSSGDVYIDDAYLSFPNPPTPTAVATVTPTAVGTITPTATITSTHPITVFQNIEAPPTESNFNYGDLPPLPEPYELSDPEHVFEVDFLWDINNITEVFRIIRTLPKLIFKITGWHIFMYVILLIVAVRVVMKIVGIRAAAARAAAVEDQLAYEKSPTAAAERELQKEYFREEVAREKSRLRTKRGL